jgi:hypothetical protein
MRLNLLDKTYSQLSLTACLLCPYVTSYGAARLVNKEAGFLASHQEIGH